MISALTQTLALQDLALPTLALPGLAEVLPVVAVVALAAVVQYATGFGFALVSVPLLALVMDAHSAVLVGLLVAMLGNLTQAIEGRHVVDRPVVGRILAASVLGMPLGWLVFTRSDPRVLQLKIGGVILLAFLALARGLTLPGASPRTDLAIGALAGFLTTCTSTNGPPVVALLHARREPPHVFRATTTTTFLALNILAVAAFVWSGQLTLDHLATALLTLPGLVAGALVGVRARRLLPPDTFRVLVLVLLTATALTAIGTAL